MSESTEDLENVAEATGETIQAVEEAEAPAQEATAPAEPEEVHETSQPTEAQAEESVEGTSPAVEDEPVTQSDATTEESKAVEATHSEDGPVADQNVEHVVDTNPESTDNNNVVEEAPSTPASVPEPVQPVDPYEEYIKAIMAGSDINQQVIVNTVNRYYTTLKPRTPVSIKDGAAAQIDLWRAIYNTINNSTNFKSDWTVWLNMFNHYKDSIFSIQYAFRFFEFMMLPMDQTSAFQRILNLLILTSSPTNRKEPLKGIDLERTLSVYFTDRNKNTVMNFYN